MADNDTKSIEYLSLKITSSTEEAVIALNNLSVALEGLIAKTGKLSEASANVASFGKSLSNLATAIRSTITASKNITFTGAESEARELDRTINKLSKGTLSTFGINGKKTVSEYRKAFSDVVREYQDTGDVRDSLGAAAKIIEDNTHIVDHSKDSYIEFANAIDRAAKSGKKIPAGFKFADLGAGADIDSAKRVLGKILTESTTGSGDFESWAQELSEAHAGVFSVGNTVSETMDNIVRAYDEGKNAFLDYKKAIEASSGAGGTEGFTAEDAIIGDLDRAIRKANELKQSVTYGQTDNDVFRNIAESVKELDGVNMPNMDNIAQFANSVSSLNATQISSIGKSLTVLGNAISKMKVPDNWADTAHFLTNIREPIRQFENLNLPSFKPLNDLQKALSGLNSESYTIAATNLSAIVPVIKDFAAQMKGVGFEGVDDLGNAIKTIAKLGHANIQKSIDNMPKLAAALEKLIEQLNALPAVNDKTLRLVEALGQLKIKGVDAGKELKSASGGLNLFGKSAQKAKGHTTGLVSVFIKARAVIYALRRAFDALKGSIDLASDLIEVQNVVDVTFGNYSSHLQGIAENAIESYGLSELTFKSVASQFQAMGSAMGISNTQVQDATKSLNEMGIAYGETTGAMGDMSTTLTELAADMASFYNKDIEDVQTAMTAVYTGQTRPLRQFGIDLTQATLKEWAMSQGLNSNIEAMTQAEKTMLRYQYVLAHTGASQGDFVRTMDTWHNQTVILKEEFKALGVVIGTGLINALKPFVTAMNATMKNVIGFAENVVNALGQIFGWQMEITGGGLASDYLDDIADEASSIGDGLSGGVGDAAKSAKELKDILLGIDELNVISPDTGSSGGSSGGSGSGSGSSGATGGSGASDAVSATLKRTKAFYESDIENLHQLGGYISTTLRDTLAGINWDDIYKGASNFGKGLASFLNGLIRPDTFGEIGGAIAGALNTALSAIDGFFTEFDGENFGKSLAAGVNKLFEKFDFILLSDTLLKFAEDLWGTLVGFLTTVDPVLVGSSIKNFIGHLVLGILSGVARALAEGLSNIAGAASENPLFAWVGDGLDFAAGKLNDFADAADNKMDEIEREAKKTSKELAADISSSYSDMQKSGEKTFSATTKAVHDFRQSAYRELTGLNSDWNRNNKLSLEVTYPNVTADAQNRMNQIKEYWNANKKLPNLEVMYNDFSSSFKVTVQDLQNWFNNHRNMGKITVETPTITANHSANSGLNFTTVYHPMAYASGGYPNIGELFYAGEHGIAEIAGSVNGRTAVAGGAEITGIKKAVEAETAVLASLLSRIASLNAEIAAKDTTVTIGGRTVSKVINKHQARAGYSFT